MNTNVPTNQKEQNYHSQCEVLKNSITVHKRNQAKLNDDVNTLKQKQNELRGIESIKVEYTKIHKIIKEQEKLKEDNTRREDLKAEQIDLREQYTKSKDTITQLLEQTKEHTNLIKKEKELETHIVEYKNIVEQKLEEEKAIEKKIARKDKLIAEVNVKIEKIKELGRETACPICTRPLLDEYDNVLQSLEEIIKHTQTQKIAKAKEELEKLKQDKQKAQEQFTKINHEYFQVSKSINLIESKRRDLIKEEEHLEKIKAQGLKNKEELEKLGNQVYDITSYQNALEKQKELKEKYEYTQNLETILLHLDKAQEELNTVTTTINKLNIKYDELTLEYKEENRDEVGK